MDWHGRTREREVKLQLLYVPRNPYHGLAWSNARTRGKVVTFFQLFGVTRNPYHGLAWSSDRTRGKVDNFSGPRATLAMDWRGGAREREVPQGSRATFCGDWRGRAFEREVNLLLFGFRIPAQPSTSLRSHREKYIDDNR